MFLKILQNSQENTCPRGSFLIKLQAEADSGTGIFLVNFAKFLSWTFLQSTSRRLLLFCTLTNMLQNLIDIVDLI